MKFLAKRKFQQKIGFSFVVLTALIAINAVATVVAGISIARQLDLQREVEVVNRHVNQTRLGLSNFAKSLDRTTSQMVFVEISSTKTLIEQLQRGYTHVKLGSLASQLQVFQGDFQKYVIEADQKAALKSRALALGRDIWQQLNTTKNFEFNTGDRAAINQAISLVSQIQRQAQELLSSPDASPILRMTFVAAQLEALYAEMKKQDDIGLQRFLFRLLRDTQEYISSFEKHLHYQSLNTETESRLFSLAEKIQADSDLVRQEMNKDIQARIVYIAGLTIFIFLLSLIAALLLSRYLSREILIPVENLLGVTKKVTSGQLEAQARVAVNDEIGELSHHFNLMTQSLKRSHEELLERNRELKKAHDELEERVHIRTLELEQSNANLEYEVAIRKLSEEVIEANEKKFRAMFELSPLGIARNSPDGRFIEANQALYKLLALDADELKEKRLSDFVARDSESFWEKMLKELNVSGSFRLAATEIINLNGSNFIVRLNGTKVTDSEGYQSIWSIWEDITDQKRSEEIIWQQANFDSLTGLPNRRLFQKELEQAIINSKRLRGALGLMFIDLDKFKEVNDTLGHGKGDLLLVQAAQRINQCVRESDIVSRLGGDEFTVILPNLEVPGNAEAIALKIIRKLEQPFHLGSSKVYISASIGITFYPDDAQSHDDLMAYADQAMYQAKAEGRNRFCYFTASLQQASRQRMLLVNDLRKALDQNQFELHYQPIVNLANGRIDKAEALIRWNHPERGLVQPDEFIPVAEETGLIASIGDWVFRQAARQVKRLQTLINPGFHISVNKSPVQFNTGPEYIKGWLDFLAEIDLLSEAMVIEITEGLLLDASDDVMTRLLEFRDTGLQVSLDDFGTGYSSLAYLNRYDIDYLKIDRAFVKNLGVNSSELALCEAITVMAHKLGLKVIAEGVETALQADLLTRAGCDFAQGFFYSRPLASDDFERFLETRGK